MFGRVQNTPLKLKQMSFPMEIILKNITNMTIVKSTLNSSLKLANLHLECTNRRIFAANCKISYVKIHSGNAGVVKSTPWTARIIKSNDEKE